MSRGASGNVVGTVFRNTVWSVFSVIATPILVFLFGGLTLRYLGMEKAGFALTVSAVFGVSGRFATCGMGQAALPALASAIGSGDTHRASSVSGILFFVFAASSVIPATLFAMTAPWFVQWVAIPLKATEATYYVTLCGLAHVLSQLALAAHIALRAANRYDLVTVVTAPLAFLTGLTACVVLPAFPSLLTMALINLGAATLGLLLALVATSRNAPLLLRWHPRCVDVPPLFRYGKWLFLGNLVASCTSGVDDLFIAATCGPASVPPWAIGKRLWLTLHTFLAQHIEHLVPLLSSMQGDRQDRIVRISRAMHWYIMVVAAIACVTLAWGGVAVVAVVAGESVAAFCLPSIQAFSVYCLCFALFIVPVTRGLAAGLSRLAFDVSATQQLSILFSVVVLAAVFGAPSVYYAPIFAVPFLSIALILVGVRLGESHPLAEWVTPVGIPLGLGGILIGLSAILAAHVPPRQGFWVGIFLAVMIVPATLGLERFLGLNRDLHTELRSVSATLLQTAKKRTRVLLGKAF